MTLTLPRRDASHRADKRHHTPGRPLGIAKQAPILFIFLHATETTNHTADAPSLEWLTVGPVQASAHALIARSGLRYDLVGDHDTAYGVGEARYGPYDGWNLNLRGLNVEIENSSRRTPGGTVIQEPYTEAQYNTLAHWIASRLFSYGDFGCRPDNFQDAYRRAVLCHREVAKPYFGENDPRNRRNDPVNLDLDRVYTQTRDWFLYFHTLHHDDHDLWIF